MMYAVCAIIGVVLGALVVWLVAANRYRNSYSSKLSEAERRANTAEGSIAELRAQVKLAAEDFDKLRDTLNQEREAKVRAETQLKETIQRLEEEKKLLEDAKSKLSDTFKALSSDALKSSNEAFLALAKKSLETVLAEAKGDLGKRQEAINGLVKPLGETLKQYEQHVRSLEISRQKAYTSLEEQVKSLAVAQQQLQKETGNLVTALRTPQVRGRWGEMTLKRVAELAGMSEHCDFTEQVTAETETGRSRPDAIVHLPGQREVVVDAKVPLDAYLKALSAETEDQREKFLNDHARQLRAHMTCLAAKSYWEQFQTAPEFVVMFIPGESFFAAAVDRDHTFIEDGLEKRVVPATPTTFIALLRAIAYGWRQEQITKHAQEISYLGKQLYDRMKVLADHLKDVGSGLEKANTAYNKAVGSMEARVFPAARRFQELGVVSGSEIPAVQPIETTPRLLSTPELTEEEK